MKSFSLWPCGYVGGHKMWATKWIPLGEAAVETLWVH